MTVMRQRLHPDIGWARPYGWREVPIGDLTPLGRPQSVTVTGRGLALSWADGTACGIAAMAPGIVCLEWSRPDVAPLPESGGVVLPAASRDPAAVATVSAAGARLRTGGWALDVAADGRLGWGPLGGAPALEWRSIALGPADRGMRLLADFALAPGEAIHGCGGRTGPLNRRGATCDFFSVKVEGSKRGDYGGLTMPFVMTSRGAGLFFDNPWPHVYADFGYEQPERMRWYAPGGPARWYLLAGPEPVAMMRRWHQLTGRPALPPAWCFGLWMSYCGNTTARQWGEWVDRFRREGWPLDVIVLDLEWRGGALLADNEGGDGVGLDWHPKFGDGAALIRHAEASGVQVCLHLNTRQFGPAIARRGLAEGWLRQVEEQIVVEPSTPARADAAWALHGPRVAEGAALWWTDNGERVDGELGEGLPSRNLFGARWNQFLCERMAAAGLPGRLVLSRGDWVGAQRHCTAWPGDTCPGVDRLEEDLRFILNCAVSGVPFSGTDLAGFYGGAAEGDYLSGRMRNSENLARRLVHAFLYQPITRIHGCGVAAKFPWVLPEKLQPLLRRYAGLRYRMMPWWVNAAVAACEDGVPLVRPLWFDYPDEPELRGIEDELLVGDGLLAAPVVHEAASDRMVRLPAGTWFDYWSGVAHEGGRSHIVHAPADAEHGLPLFVRAGSVIVYGPPADRCLAQARPDELWLDAYPGRDAAGTLRTGQGVPPALGWSIRGLELELACGPGALRVHVNTGAGLRDLRLTPGAAATVHLAPAGVARTPQGLASSDKRT